MNPVDKLMQYMVHDSEFIQRIFIMLGNARLSHIINQAAYDGAHNDGCEKIKFMLDNGADPSLLIYSIQRAKLRGWESTYDWLGMLVGGRIDVSLLHQKWDDLQKERQKIGQVPDWPNPHLSRAKNFDNLLLHACHCGHTELALALLGVGVDAEAKDDDFSTAMEIAVMNGHLAIVEAMLMCGANVNYLSYAAEEGQMEISKLFLEYGADVNADKGLALRQAVCARHLSIVKLLLSHGADVHAFEEEPLHTAAASGSVEIMELLLEHGADVHSYNDRALCYAARSGNLDVVKILLRYGANINGGRYGALDWAASDGRLEVVEYLLENGATVKFDHIKDAATKGHIEVARLLMKHGAEVIKDSLLKEAIDNGDTEAINLLLPENPDAGTIFSDSDDDDDDDAEIHFNDDAKVQSIKEASNGRRKACLIQ